MSEYLFDKRKVKRLVFKYLVIFIVALIPTMAFNFLVGNKINNYALMVFLDCVIMLVIVIIGKILMEKYFDKKDRKLQARIKEREDLQKMKKQILEDSYKRKREQKTKDKSNTQKKGDLNGKK
jgi:undecaprenyl pyrophosphate phosphatase UppP